VWTLHFIAIVCPAPLLRNEAGSTPWPDNIWDTSDQRRFFGGCNTETDYILWGTNGIMNQSADGFQA